MNSIFVRRIHHLTDARYFAAMGVDWMSIHLTPEPSSFMLWHTLKEWVSGVKLAAELDTDDEMVLARTIIDARPEGIVLRKDTSLELPPDLNRFLETSELREIELQTFDKIILQFNEMLPMESILNISAEKIFLQASWTERMLLDLMSKGYAGGICFEGGDEEMTGVRDYGSMDVFMEILGR